MSRLSEQKPLSAKQLYVLLGILFFSVLPHFFHFPAFISIFFVFVLLFRIAFIHYARKPVSKIVIGIFLLLAFTSVAIPGNKVGTGFGVSLLIVMLAMKTLELKNVRDAYVFLFLDCFLLITLFLYNQEIYLWFYVWFLIFCILGFLLSLNFSSERFSLKSALKPIGLIFLQALPLLIIFFLVFPRLNGPLWAFNHQTNAAITGISGSLTPGTISQLSQSNDIAFRVKFNADAELPRPENRYWRGPVMTATDGYEWTADKVTNYADPIFETSLHDLVYQLTIEPTQQSWLFALEHPTDLPENAVYTDNFTLRSKETITKRATINLQSRVSNQINIDQFEKIEAALFVPDIVTPRLLNLVEQLQQNTTSDEAFINEVLRYFNQENFIYTLSPPIMRENPADQFLFDARAGFCEHYATSFVLLLRLADIPARVVTGYQGGEWNPTGEHLIVRQSDAHAWAEVWLDDKGWTRFDPTAAVAPERVRNSINNSLTSAGAPVRFTIENDSAFNHFLQQARWLVDTVDLNWHRWIVRFSDKKQKDLFSWAGLAQLGQYGVIVLSVIICLFFLSLLGLLLRGKQQRCDDPVIKLWGIFLKKLRQSGIEVSHFDGPQRVQQITALSKIRQRHAAVKIVDSYIALRYQKSPDPTLLSDLKKRIRQFKAK